MTTVEILRSARALIEDPADWRQGYSKRVPTCAVGALDMVREQPVGVGDDPAWIALAKAIGAPMSVGEFNDTHTHAEVLAAFDRAIVAVEGQPA